MSYDSALAPGSSLIGNHSRLKGSLCFLSAAAVAVNEESFFEVVLACTLVFYYNHIPSPRS
jgi:hypothetical protein